MAEQTPHRLSRTEARRIAVRAQLLDADRPSDLLDVVAGLTLLQADQTAAVAPSADLVLWSRLGPAYTRGELDEALESGRLVELAGMIRPTDDLVLYRAEMEQWPGVGDDVDGWRLGQATWVHDNDACRRDILERLRGDGPLTARELPDTCVRPWRSSGWNNQRNVGRMLEMMEQRGEVAVAGRGGRDRLWDLAERIHPDEPAVPADEARVIRGERRLAALGLARARSAVCPGEPNDVGEVGEPAVIEGVKGTWRVDPTQLGRSFSGRAAILSPLDRLVFDRKRMVELFEFDYQLEMYKPAAKRRWGYFALPVLYGDRLVGKIDATSHPDAGVLQVDVIHEDVPFTPTMTAKVRAELADLARCLDLEPVLPRPG